MGSTLYNKIHLGRHALLGSGPARAVLATGLCAGAVLAWALLRKPR